MFTFAITFTFAFPFFAVVNCTLRGKRINATKCSLNIHTIFVICFVIQPWETPPFQCILGRRFKNEEMNEFFLLSSLLFCLNIHVDYCFILCCVKSLGGRPNTNKKQMMGRKTTIRNAIPAVNVLAPQPLCGCLTLGTTLLGCFASSTDSRRSASSRTSGCAYPNAATRLMTICRSCFVFSAPECSPY